MRREWFKEEQVVALAVVMLIVMTVKLPFVVMEVKSGWRRNKYNIKHPQVEPRMREMVSLSLAN